MFVGRNRELQKLNQMYESGQFEFAVVYGRRRVGKTTLINEFIKNREAVFYMAVEGNRQENLTGLSGALLNGVDGNQRMKAEFKDYSDVLDYIDELSKNDKRLIMVIDEFPYLAASYPAISSMLQSHIDNCWKDSKLFLILCGSSMSFMEEQVLGYKSPLYGRRTAQFKIHPFTFFEAEEMLQSFHREERAILYGVTGGIPEYLSRINQQMNMDDNIIHLFFEESGRLFEEPSNLLKQELREPMTYHSIISAIAGGASRLNEIATKTGMETSGCSNQLTSLTALGLVKKEVPVTENSSGRKTIYTLNDSMFLFWYRFVRPNLSAITRGVGASIYDTRVKEQLNDYMGSIFEEICRQYLYLSDIYKNLPFPIGEIGRWWGNNPKEKRQEEIDLMAVDGEQILLGECKWRNAAADADVVHTLVKRSGMFSFERKYYIIFSKSGFTEGAYVAAAEYGKTELISFMDM